MVELKVGFDNWPFGKDERVKLIKISKPYLAMGQWYVDAGYLSAVTNKVKYLKHFVGDLHLLIVGVDYIDGIRQNMFKWESIEIQLSAKLISSKKIEPRLIEDKMDNRFNYYTFGIGLGKDYYIVPLTEFVRVILAPDVFWLHQITLLDSIDTRVLWDCDGEILNLNFSTDVPIKYVKMDTKIKHMAWIFSNPVIYNMMNQVSRNIRNGNGILFDFLFDELKFTARVETWNGKNYVREIIGCKGKKILCSDIILHHSGLIEYETDDKDSEDKNRKKGRVISDDGDKRLVSGLAATANVIDVVQDDSMEFEYISVVKIERIKTPQSGSRSNVSQVRGANAGGSIKRTTGDVGGLETAPQLEFEHAISEKPEGFFADRLAVLKLMEGRSEVVSIGYHSGDLSDHFRGRSVCTLDDWVTPRKYLVGHVRLVDGKEAALIEVEKADLTTLMVVSSILQDWNLICHKIIRGFIERSGSWPDIGEVGIKDIVACKFRHTNVDVRRREKRIFDQFINVCK